MEAIDFQAPDFAVLLENLFSQALSQYSTNAAAQKSSIVTTIEKATRKQTGMNVKIAFESGIGGALSFSMRPSINYVLNDPELAKVTNSRDPEQVEKILKSWGSRGYVDIHKGKVGGAYSGWPVAVLIDLQLAKQIGWSSKEMAAVYLHEVGHGFTAFELIDRTVISSLAMSTVIHRYEQVNGNVSDKRYVTQLKVAGMAVGQDPSLYSELESVTNKETIINVILSTTYAEARSDIGFTSGRSLEEEISADAFASSFGLGREVVSALVKLDTALRRSSALMGVNNVAGVLLTIVTFIVLFFLGASALSSIIAGIGFFNTSVLTIVFAVMFNKGYNSLIEKANPLTHEDLYDRYLKIKNTEIARLKNSKLSSEDKNIILDSYATIDNAIKAMKKETNVLSTIVELVSPGARKKANAVKLERQLDNLAHNSLYVNAARVSSMYA